MHVSRCTSPASTHAAQGVQGRMVQHTAAAGTRSHVRLHSSWSREAVHLACLCTASAPLPPAAWNAPQLRGTSSPHLPRTARAPLSPAPPPAPWGLPGAAGAGPPLAQACLLGEQAPLPPAQWVRSAARFAGVGGRRVVGGSQDAGGGPRSSRHAPNAAPGREAQSSAGAVAYNQLIGSSMAPKNRQTARTSRKGSDTEMQQARRVSPGTAWAPAGGTAAWMPRWRSSGWPGRSQQWPECCQRAPPAEWGKGETTALGEEPCGGHRGFSVAKFNPAMARVLPAGTSCCITRMAQVGPSTQEAGACTSGRLQSHQTFHEQSVKHGCAPCAAACSSLHTFHAKLTSRRSGRSPS